MIEHERLVRARLGILALAAELHNVVKACKLAGMSRSQFYAMKKAYEAYGKEGLLPRVRRKPAMPNRTPQHIEQEILLVTRKKPMLSYIRLADEINTEGMDVTPSMVRYVWRRYGLSTRSARVKWVRSSSQGNWEKVSAVTIEMPANRNPESHTAVRPTVSEPTNSLKPTETSAWFHVDE